MTIVQEITLDTLREHAVKVVTAKQLDENSRFVKVHLRQGGAVLKAPAHSIVTLSVCRADDKAKTFEGKATDDGSVLIQLPNWMLELPGTCSCSVNVVDGEEKLSTLNFVVKVEPAPCDNTDITEDESYDILISLINEVKAIRNRNFIFVDIKHLGDSLGFDAKEILDIYHMTNRYIVVDGKEFELRDGDILFVADSAVPTYWVKGDKIYNIEVRKPDQSDITNLLTWQSGVNDGSIVVGRASADEDGNNIKNTYATQSTTQSLEDNKVNRAGDEVSGDYNLTNGSITIVSDADSRSARLSNDGVILADAVDGTSTRFTDGQIHSKFLEDTGDGDAVEKETVLHIPRKDGTLSTYEELDALAKELRHDDEVDRNALQEHIAAYAEKTDTIISRLNVNDENIANAQTSVNRAQHSADNAQNTADRAIDNSEQAIETSNQALSLANEAIAVKSIADEAMEIAVNAKNKSDQIADEAIGILSDVANDLEVALTAEVKRSVDADNDLSAALDAEIQRAVAADEILDTAIKTLTDGVKPEEIDGVKDLINYVNEHGAEFIQVQKDVAANTEAIEKNNKDLAKQVSELTAADSKNKSLTTSVKAQLEERTKIWYANDFVVKTLTETSVSGQIALDADILPGVGSVVNVIYDNKPCTFVVKTEQAEGFEIKYVGNASLYDNTMPNTGEDFAIGSPVDMPMSLIIAPSEGIHTISLERYVEEVWLNNVELIGQTPVELDISFFSPAEEDLIEIVRDGIRYEAHLIRIGEVLVPDFMVVNDEINTDTLPFALVYWISEAQLTIVQYDDSSHIYSVYKLGGPKKLPEEYLPTPDGTLNPESERPVQNKAVAQALANKFDIPVEYEYGSYVPIYRGDIKETGVLPFTDFATPYTVAYRGEDGRVQVGSPTADYDATPKTYVDEKIGDISTAIDKEKIVNDKQQNYLDYLNGVESEGLNIQIDWANSSAIVVDAGEFRGENLVIPSHYQGFPVTTIGEQAFNYASVYAPKRIKIPDTVTSILGGAFQENSAIDEVVLPRNLKHIEGGAFEYFYGKSLIIPKSVETIDGYAFTSSEVTLYIEAESKPDGWSDEWDEMHIGEVVWGYIPDFESVTEKIGDISTALDAILAKQNAVIGGV